MNNFAKFAIGILFAAVLSIQANAACTCIQGISKDACEKINDPWIKQTESSSLKNQYDLGTCLVKKGFHRGGLPPANCVIKSAKHATVESYINGEKQGTFHVFNTTYEVNGIKKTCTSFEPLKND
ncbi:hypothetical protein ACDW_23430 [Acidovorax sp. DW039]|uniref:hypothetical protein n=1 Tax=Acidovorax sp. DW039 TaxID=3095606 RepID=UPI00308B0489|nr:hypothetical protein ACDW_23430 [Acidovorax sp. DW039]